MPRQATRLEKLIQQKLSAETRAKETNATETNATAHSVLKDPAIYPPKISPPAKRTRRNVVQWDELSEYLVCGFCTYYTLRNEETKSGF